jgi:hypothetical protein
MHCAALLQVLDFDLDVLLFCHLAVASWKSAPPLKTHASTAVGAPVHDVQVSDFDPDVLLLLLLLLITPSHFCL